MKFRISHAVLFVVFALLAFCSGIYFDNLSIRKLLYLSTLLLHGHGLWVMLGVLSAYLLSVILFLTAFFSRSAIVRGVFFALFFFALANELSWQIITGQGFEYDNADLLISEFHFAGEAVGSFFPLLAAGLALAGLVTCLMFLASRFIKIRFTASVTLVLLVLTAVSMYFFFANSGHLHSFTTKHPFVFYSSYQKGIYTGPRDETLKAKFEKKHYRNVIFIVDESIRGDFLQINGYDKETTPFLSSVRKGCLNFGVASSGGNCSALSNLILYSGIQLPQIPDSGYQSLKIPTLFEYAKKAGYYVSYYDAQGDNGSHQNFMRSYDFRYIDNFRQERRDYPLKNDEHNDMLIASEIKALLLKNPSQCNFIYVNKYGAHFRYERTYPSSFRYFTPCMGHDEYITGAEKGKVINSYCNSIRWSVDHFFEELLAGINLDDTVIVYTSDHGQSILEPGGEMTHGTVVNPSVNQANVPLLVFTNNRIDGLKRYSGFNMNKCTHFMLFPSLLVLMGYNESEVVKSYGLLLWSRTTADTRVFLSGNIFNGCIRNKFDISVAGSNDKKIKKQN